MRRVAKDPGAGSRMIGKVVLKGGEGHGTAAGQALQRLRMVWVHFEQHVPALRSRAQRRLGHTGWPSGVPAQSDGRPANCAS